MEPVKAPMPEDEQRRIPMTPAEAPLRPAEPGPGGRPGLSIEAMIESREFKRLVARRWTISGILLALLFAVYYGYILLVGMNKAFLTRKIGAFTTLGIPIGVGVIVFAFIVTAIYVAWANSSYDPEVERLKGRLHLEE